MAMTSNPPNSCWSEAGNGLPSVGPTGTTSDWREYRSYTRTDGSTTSSNAINLYQNNDKEWLLSQHIDPTINSLKLVIEVAVTNYKSSGLSSPTETDNMGPDDEVQLLITRDNGVTWDNITTWNSSNQPLVTGTTFEFDMSSETTDLQFAFWATDGSIDNIQDYDFHVGEFRIEDIPCTDVTVNNSYVGCEGNGYSITINSNVYNELNPSGIDTLMSTQGCDSIINTNLVFNPVSQETVIETTCIGALSYNGQSYTSTGIYTQTLTNTSGCDSVLTLDLTIETSDSVFVDTLLCGETSFEYEGFTMTSTGHYEFEQVQSSGCPKILVIDIEFVDEFTVSITQNGDSLISNQTTGTFQWYVCTTNLPILGEVDHILIPQIHGAYYIEVTQNGCTYKSNCLTTSGIGTDELDINGFTIYPNPNKGTFNISLNSIGDYKTLRITTILGQTLHEASINSDDLNIKVDLTLESGIYNVQLLTKNQKWVNETIIIE